MSETKTQSSGALTVDVSKDDSKTTVVFRGKSNEREPTRFLMPILTDVLVGAGNGTAEVVLDFQTLEYMNSSTITPIIKVLEQARREKHRVSLVYRAGLKWQELSFTALTIFQTPDGRIKVQGV